jgi:endoribonuclease Dicer
VAEAILGAAYLSGGDEVARSVLKTLKLPLPHLDRWKDMTHRLCTVTNASTSIRLRPGTIAAIEEILDYRFKHPHLLAQALVSRLYPH